MVRLHVGRAARERDLDRGGPPGDEVGELALADAEEGLVDLGRVSGSDLVGSMVSRGEGQVGSVGEYGKGM